MPNAVQTVRGPGQTGLTTTVYNMILRMLAENFPVRKIIEATVRAFPLHSPTGDDPLTYNRVSGLRQSRVQEIRELRDHLNAELDDLWITNKRSRVQAYQLIFEDANRWTPKRVLELENPEREGDPRSVVVYEKDMGTMLQALKHAREEIGADAGGRVADSLESLVALAEDARGLQRTEGLGEIVEGAVPVTLDAALVEIPALYPSRGADGKMHMLDGNAGMDDAVASPVPTDGENAD